MGKPKVGDIYICNNVPTTKPEANVTVGNKYLIVDQAPGEIEPDNIVRILDDAGECARWHKRWFYYEYFFIKLDE